MTLDLMKLIPWLPAIAAVLCGICAMQKSLRVFAAPICILAIFASFLLAFLNRGNLVEGGSVVHFFEWINVGGFKADFSYFIDPLTMLMLFVVCGIGTLVAWYAAFYMKGDKGYARFFTFVSLFIFAMTNLVMADNLVLLYLGWEGVGLCSYLLIGFYYNKPSAVAAAKKAFIVNRIGDLGFALGIFLTYQTFGTVSLSEVVAMARQTHETTSAHLWIPFLLMLGAFGKSAQLPLYMWLPDAMEGPTPVSALIHAATMVTAGVYMIARLLPVFMLSPYALPTVAVIGGLTAVFAATIALCQYDIKRIYAYSTISQLGYMFLGVGVLSSVGGVFHLFTHAFFKALLFLTAGSVMHALAGQLDLRKMSGLAAKMPVTCVLMLLGCLALAGFPFTAGFYSKDMILAAVMEKGIGHHGQALYLTLAILGLFTAFLTAFYTFRLWFRVFLGPVQYEMGEEHHGAEEHGQGGHAGHAGHGEADKAHAPSDIKVEHHHDAHEMPLLMNLPLMVLAVGAIAAGFLCHHWVETMVGGSTAAVHTGGDHAHHATLFGMDLHLAMMVISSVISIFGISLAAYFHWFNRPAADAVARQYKGLVSLLNNKYYVDELIDTTIVKPLHTKGEVFFVIDRLIIDGLVSLVGWVPGGIGRAAAKLQNGALQGYGLGMAAGLAATLIYVLYITH